MIDITSNLKFEDSFYELNLSNSNLIECTTTAYCNIPLFIHSCTIITTGYYYHFYKDNGVNKLEENGFAGKIYVTVHFDDNSEQYVGSTVVSGAYRDILTETHEIGFNIPKEHKNKKIKKILFKYEKLNSKYQDAEEHTFHFETKIKVVSIKVYGKLAGVDSGLRVAGKNGQVFKILETTEPSPLKFFYKRVRNIMLVPTDHPLVSPLRIKTADGIMSIAVEK